jgi:hypothetical protein
VLHSQVRAGNPLRAVLVWVNLNDHPERGRQRGQFLLADDLAQGGASLAAPCRNHVDHGGAACLLGGRAGVREHDLDALDQPPVVAVHDLKAGEREERDGQPGRDRFAVLGAVDRQAVRRRSSAWGQRRRRAADVTDPRFRRDGLGELVRVAGLGDAGADVKELPDAKLARQVADGTGKERPARADAVDGPGNAAIARSPASRSAA